MPDLQLEEVRRNIKHFWPKLERQLTRENALDANKDTKLPSYDPQKKAVVILPHDSPQFDYYSSDKSIEVKVLPKLEDIDDQTIYKLSREQGILALEFDQESNLPEKYVVPGGRFNEFYGWDSYFIARGLLNDGHVDLAADIADQFSYEIKNYGKILNANRPYFLGRSQPPFLTDLAFRVLDATGGHMLDKFIAWIKAAILEYKTLWRSKPRYDPGTKLSRYFAQGRGIPPEVEGGHFDRVIAPIAKRHNLSVESFIEKYNSQEIEDEELDAFLTHDRAVRESGIDVTTRFVNVCADLVTIDLCALLYKYECDIAKAIAQYPQHFPDESEAWWTQRANQSKLSADKYLWISMDDGKSGFFCDYNIKKQEQHRPLYTATTLYALWSGLASEEQAKLIVNTVLPQVEFDGGLASTSKLELGDHDSRQWDYPAGWAPHQILAWEGLRKYGYETEAIRLATKWINTVCQGANMSDPKGGLFEKYDVTGVENPQDVRAEYGNQGSNVTGFGWTNASFAIAYDKYRQSK